MLKGKVIVVTGAGSGIGRATAVILAEAGAKLVVSGRSGPEVKAAADEIRRTGGVAVAVTTDVTRETGVVAPSSGPYLNSAGSMVRSTTPGSRCTTS